MNYSKVYDSLIDFRRNNPPDGGEAHHVLPRCLGGTDCLDNLVRLTWREHFVAHRLLARIYPEESGLKYAVYMMTLIQADKTRKPNSRQVAVARRSLSEAAKQRGFKPGRTDVSRKRARERMLSDRNPIKEDPSKNHTAYPVLVKYEDGREILYPYAKAIPIPYGTIKHIKKHNTGSAKHGILSIERLK